jgi:myo-inositol-1(or 4)-monophosphatase
MDLQAVRASAEAIAREAGAVLMRFFDQPHTERTKKTLTDIVTEGDMASEAVIIPALRQRFPDHAIASEEGGGTDSTFAETADYCWHVDPLDGTSNYASNIPFFSVSIGLANRDMKPLVGVVYDPFGYQLFSAARGFGATLNGKRLHVSSSDSLRTSMLVSGFPYDSETNSENNLREWGAFVTRTRGTRRFGSVALELSFVAAGRFDGLWEQRLNTWDVAAGILMVQEAGGVITDYSGHDSDVMSGREVVASNGLIHESMLTVLREARSTP